MDREQLTKDAARAMLMEPGDSRAEAVLDAILPQVTTVEELEALPDRALVVTANGEPLQNRNGSLWHSEDDDYWYASWYTPDSLTRLGPLTVVWRP